jgi:hypothetical protein
MHVPSLSTSEGYNDNHDKQYVAYDITFIKD